MGRAGDSSERAAGCAVAAGAAAMGFDCRGVIESPIRGAKEGNKEFLGAFVFARPEQAPAPPRGGSGAEEDGGGSDGEGEVGEKPGSAADGGNLAAGGGT